MTTSQDRTGITAPRDELIALGRRVRRPGEEAGRRVVTSLAGNHASRFCGTGLEFAEVRAYQPGDDVRAIDWRVTARTGRPHSKLFEIELERPAWFAVDFGPSMQFATRGVLKSVAAAQAASVLAWRAHRAGERVGGVVTSPGVSVELPPGRTRSHLFRLLDALAAGTEQLVAGDAGSGEPRFERELGWLRERARTGSKVAVVSDFYGLNRDLEGVLRGLARRAELTLVWVHDPVEAEAPPPGWYRVSDGQRHGIFEARRGNAWRNAYGAAFAKRGEALRNLVRETGARLVPLRTDASVADVLGRRRAATTARKAS